MSSLVDRFIHRYGRLPTERDPDYLEMLRMSKYRILDFPDINPAKCANCGSAKPDGRQYIDFGLQIDFYGALFFCGFCLKDIATNMGLFKAIEEDLVAAHEKLMNLRNLEEQGNLVQETVLRAVEEVKEYFASLHSLGNDVIPYIGVVPSDSEASGEPTAIANEPEVVAAKPGVIKSTSSSRSKNLPSLAELIQSES